MIDYGMKEMVLYVFSAKNLLNKDKIRFFYRLNGRNKKPGILDIAEGIHFGYCTILVPYPNRALFEGFLRKWRIAFDKKTILAENIA